MSNEERNRSSIQQLLVETQTQAEARPEVPIWLSSLPRSPVIVSLSAQEGKKEQQERAREKVV